MYMLNLVYDRNKTNGLFEPYDPNAPVLERSLCWLKLLGGNEPTHPNDPSFVPEYRKWDDLGRAAAVLLRKKDDPGWICIRAVSKPGTPLGDNLQLVAAFGRPARFGQPQASPFTHDEQETGRIQTTFVFGPEPANKGVTWLYTLRKIAKKGPKENATHRYEFAVGLVVNPGDEERHFGEDPEMDIEL